MPHGSGGHQAIPVQRQTADTPGPNSRSSSLGLLSHSSPQPAHRASSSPPPFLPCNHCYLDHPTCGVTTLWSVSNFLFLLGKITAFCPSCCRDTSPRFSTHRESLTIPFSLVRINPWFFGDCARCHIHLWGWLRVSSACRCSVRHGRVHPTRHPKRSFSI